LGVQTLAQSVVDFIRRQELMRAGDRIGIAVSGGLDSVALLRLLLGLQKQLGVVLSVVHFNHKLRGAEADADELFVAALARSYDLDFHCDHGDVAAHAAGKCISLETAAREMRYEYFIRLLQTGGLNRIATAHTLDDQAETVLMRVVRGAGTGGLAGIYPRLSVNGSQFSGQASIIRPLLGTRRLELEAFLREAGQTWREDSTNRDLRYSRNRVRHGILPRLEQNFNPAVREALAETAEIARAEEEYWKEKIAGVLPELWEDSRLRITALVGLPLAVQRRVIRAAAESLGLQLEFTHVEQVLQVCMGGSKSAALPQGWLVSQNGSQLQFERGGMEENCDYEYFLPVPGRVEVPELNTCFEALPGEPGYNRDHLLDRRLLAKKLLVRNWRAGDRFWPAHSKAPKKIKELLQTHHLTGSRRKLWPVVVSGADIVWLRGFTTPTRLQPVDATREVILIRELSRFKETAEDD
jgi:tRNA(Ile)-lysidine synthase